MKKFKGYTLVELLVAFAIFAILIIPISGMINTFIKGNKSSKQKLELANIYNYAYESYLNSPKQEEEHMGYNIKFENINQTEYQLSGIDYNNYDLLFKINGNVLETKWNVREQAMNEFIWNFQIESGQLINGQEKINNVRVYIKKNEERKYLYKISFEKVVTNNDGTENKITEIQEKEVNNPTGNMLFDINNNSTYKLNLLVDGVYDNNDEIIDRVISLNYINKPNDNNIKIASVYPNVEFITKEQIEFNKNQNVEYVKISIYKDNNLLDEKVYEFSKILK